MGRLYKPTRKLKNGKKWKSKKWYIEYQDANGKQVRIPATRSKSEAKLMLLELEVKAKRVRMGLEKEALKKPRMKLSELCDLFLNDIKIRVKQATLFTYKTSLRDLVYTGLSDREEPWFTVKYVSDLTPELVLGYQASAGETLSPKTVNLRLRVLLQVLNWGVRNNFIEENPLCNIQLLPERVVNRSRSFTPIELTQLFNASSVDVRGIWEVFVETGMRKKEMSTLRWDDIDWIKKKIIIRAEISKNYKSRFIPMSDIVIRVLKEREQLDKSEHVFPTIGKWNSFYAGCYKELKGLCEQLEIKGVNIHSFRRTFAVRQLQNGVSPASVQRMMGHATANLTLEVYALV